MLTVERLEPEDIWHSFSIVDPTDDSIITIVKNVQLIYYFSTKSISLIKKKIFLIKYKCVSVVLSNFKMLQVACADPCPRL